MYRIFVVAVAGIALSGCASFSLGSFSSAPPDINIPLDSIPPGAEAKTSLGPGCRTPCTVSVPAAESFTVTFTLPRYEGQTVPVQIIRVPGDFTSPPSTIVDPNPVLVELQPAGPPPRGKRPPPRKQTKQKARAATAAPPPAGSPFPDPVRR